MGRVQQNAVLLKGKQPLLRSKAPALVAQEVYGLLLAHFVARRVMAEDCGRRGESSDETKSAESAGPVCPFPP